MLFAIRRYVFAIIILFFNYNVFAIDNNTLLPACIAGDVTACAEGSCSFVAAVIPLDVNNVDIRGNDVLFTFFEPAKSERWAGNVKKLVLRDLNHNGIYSILDVVNLALAESGFPFTEGIDDKGIRMDALTFWTQPDLLALPDIGKNEMEGRDGRSVMRGGAGQRMLPMSQGAFDGDTSDMPKFIYTENAGDNGLMVLNAVNANDSLFHLFNLDDHAVYDIEWFSSLAGLPVALTVQQKQYAVSKMMVDYAYGANLESETYDYRSAFPVNRDWILGDVIHSRPLVMDYGSISGKVEDSHRRIIFGANDGMLHIFENSHEKGGESLVEKYSFIPRELLKLLPILAANEGRYNQDQVHHAHPYGMDGQVTSLVFDDTSNPDNRPDIIDTDISGVKDFAYIYTGMRRGGKSYYALDIADPFKEPEYMGSIQKKNPDFKELGLTFSNAIPVIVKFDDNATPALVFSGGYTVAKDDYRLGDVTGKSHAFPSGATGYFDNTHGTTPDAEGNAIYIVHAITLELIWKSTNQLEYGNGDTHYYNAGLDVAIPSTVRPVDADGNGFMDRLYVGDIAGNVWRGDFPECGKEGPCAHVHHRRDHWTLTKIAAFSTSSASGDVRFFHPPAVVSTRDHLGNYDALVIGSGDRENPLELTDINRIYMIKDRHTVSGMSPVNVIKPDDLADVTLCVSGLEQACPGLKKMVNGWRIDLPSGVGVDAVHANAGEKVLSQPIIVNGKIWLTTYQANPVSAGSCVADKGVSNLYLIDLQDGTAANDNPIRYVEIASGMVGDVTIAGQNIVLPGIAPLDFLLSDEEMKEHAATSANPVNNPAADNVIVDDTIEKVSVFPAGVAGVEFLYWRNMDISDTR